MMKSLIAAAGLFLAAIFAAVPAAAQSSCPYIAYGAVLTAGQWNACFQAKQDSFFAQGSTTTVLHGGSGSPTFGPVVLTTDVTGVLPIANGGSGVTSGTSGGIPYYSSSTTLASSAALSANQIVLGGGAATTPASLGSLGTTSTVLHGNAAGAPTFAAVGLTTDVTGILPGANGGSGNGFFAVTGPTTSLKTFTFPNASATVLTTNAGVTNAQLATAGANTMKGNWTGSTAAVADNTMPVCADSGGNHLNYVNGTGVTCGTSGAGTGPLWKLNLTGTQTISTSTAVLMHANNATYDTATACNISTTWVCTPLTSGYYSITCTARIDASAGPPLNSAISRVILVKNGSAIMGADEPISAQTNLAGSATSGTASITTNVQLNGSTDTVGCQVYSDGATGTTVITGTWNGQFIRS